MGGRGQTTPPCSQRNRAFIVLKTIHLWGFVCFLKEKWTIADLDQSIYK